MRFLRVFLSFLVQPVIVGVAVFLLAPLIDATGRPLYGGSSPDHHQLAVALAAGAALVAGFVLLFGAAPWLAWLMRRGFVTAGEVMLAGVLLGNLPALLIFIRLVTMRNTFDPNELTYGWYGLLRIIVIGTTVGTISAAAFWLLAGSALRRADRPA